MGAFTLAGADHGQTLVKELYHDSFVNTVYFNGFMGLWAKLDQGGGQKYNWIARKELPQNAEIFTEGQAAPAVDAADYAACAVSPVYHRSNCQITGHAIDAMRANHVGMSVVDAEMAAAAEATATLMTQSFLGSTYGIDLAIDATSTYAGVARGAATWFESQETSLGSAPLATSDLLDMLETLRNDPIGARVSHILMPANLATDLYYLGGAHVIHNSDPSDKAPGLFSQRVAGVPVTEVGELDDNTIFFVDNNSVAGVPNVAIAVQRPMGVFPQSPSGDSSVYQVSSAASFVVHKPKVCGKLTDVA